MPAPKIKQTLERLEELANTLQPKTIPQHKWTGKETTDDVLKIVAKQYAENPNLIDSIKLTQKDLVAEYVEESR